MIKRNPREEGTDQEDRGAGTSDLIFWDEREQPRKALELRAFFFFWREGSFLREQRPFSEGEFFRPTDFSLTLHRREPVFKFAPKKGRFLKGKDCCFVISKGFK